MRIKKVPGGVALTRLVEGCSALMQVSCQMYTHSQTRSWGEGGVSFPKTLGPVHALAYMAFPAFTAMRV